MPVPISNVTRRQVYAPSGAGGAGPYSFTFEILANTDIAVFKDDVLLTLTTHYTVVINANGTGSVTITATGLALAPASPTQYAIVGNRTIARATDFTTGGDFFANTLNDELDQQTIFAQQNAEGLIRSLQAPQTDPTTVDMTLPRASVRANKTLAFDANGDPTTGEVIGDNRGNWAAPVAYNKRDIVKDTSNGNIYYANTSHTSSGSQPISTNADSAKWDLIVDNASAGASATAAAASASAASTSASNASTSASNASSSASTASTQASNASTSATNASNSATAAASSASTASTAATNAGNSATAASTSATNASNSATSASGSASTATTQASNASTSATAAAGSASTATTQATNAATSASGASTSASNAATSASNASASETAAAASAASAAASFDAFDDIYLGAKASNPTVDNDGNALTTGDQYFNTASNELRVWNGSTWQSASTVGGTVTSVNVTGVASFADGSAAAPSITNDGDTNTGIFFPAADTIAFAEGGAEAMRIDSSGNVGIGTSSPRDVAGYVSLGLNDTTGGLLDFYANGTRVGGIVGVSGNLQIGTATATPLIFNTDTNERARIDSSGNVGIGTASPTVRLHASGSANYVAGVESSNTFALLGFKASGSGGTMADPNVAIGANANDLYFRAGGTERARIDSSGNLLVGGTSTFASSKVVIECPSGTQSVAFGIASNVTRTSGTQYGYSLYRDNVDETNAVTFVENGSSGNNAASYVVRTNAATGGGGVTNVSGGVALVQGATSWSSYSDLRLKHDVVPVTNAIESILKIDPIFFKWNDRPEDQQRSIGVSAQSVEKVFPELIDRSGVYDLEGGAMQVRYTELIPVLLAAIQEQQALITQQAEAITALTTRITALEAAP